MTDDGVPPPDPPHPCEPVLSPLPVDPGPVDRVDALSPRTVEGREDVRGVRREEGGVGPRPLEGG